MSTEIDRGNQRKSLYVWENIEKLKTWGKKYEKAGLTQQQIMREKQSCLIVFTYSILHDGRLTEQQWGNCSQNTEI